MSKKRGVAYVLLNEIPLCLLILQARELVILMWRFAGVEISLLGSFCASLLITLGTSRVLFGGVATSISSSPKPTNS